MSSIQLTYSRNELLPEKKTACLCYFLGVTVCLQSLNPQLSEAELLLQRASHLTHSYDLVNLEPNK